MKFLALTFFVLNLLLMSFASTAVSSKCSNIFHQNKKDIDVDFFKSSSVRMISRSLDGEDALLSGSGFFIDKNTIVTNYHVAEAAYFKVPLSPNFFAMDLFGNILPVEIKAMSPKFDLVFLEVDTSQSDVRYEPLEIRTEKAKLGEKFYVFKEDFSIKSDEKLKASDEDRYRVLKLSYMYGRALDPDSSRRASLSSVFGDFYFSPFGRHEGTSGSSVVDSEGRLASVVFFGLRRAGVLVGVQTEELKEMIAISEDKNLEDERVFCNRKGLSFKECMKEITGEDSVK